MPPFVPAPNCVLHEEIGYVNLDALIGRENTFWFRRLTGAPNLFNVTALNTALATWYKTSIMPLLASELTWIQATTKDRSTISGVSANYSAFPVNGGNASGILPSNVGLRFDFQSGVPGRAYNGGNVVHSLPRDQVVGDFVSVDLADQLRSAYVELFSIATVQGWEWVIVSLRSGGEWRSEAVVTPVTSVDYRGLRVDACRYRFEPGIF